MTGSRQVADQAEQAVIGCLMDIGARDPDLFVTVVGIAPPESFYRPANTTIMRAIVDQFTADRPTDPVSVAGRLAETGDLERVDGVPYLHTCTAAALPAQATHHAEIIARDHQRRGNAELAARLGQLAEDGDLDKFDAYLVEAAGRRHEQDDGWAGHLVPGGSFVLNAPESPPALWGHGETIAWAQGESLMICGPAGVGKTTLAVQLVAARLGIGDQKLLGMPAAPGRKRVLYLAMDRPPQIARAMGRLFGPADRHALDERLVVHKGPPPHDLARKPETLAQMCRMAGADTVVVDSLKDAVLKLSDDESGSGYNRARQAALVDGVEVLELHHQRKANGDNKKPAQLADVYGSTWLTAGAGSVLLLWGNAGDPVVELTHLKQPREQIGPLLVVHDHHGGRSEIHDQVDVLTLVRYQGAVGMTPKLLASMLFGADKPTQAEVEKARRKLTSLARTGLLYEQPGQGQLPSKFFLAERIDGDGRS